METQGKYLRCSPEDSEEESMKLEKLRKDDQCGEQEH